jgi:BirA family biotin operon repressor/biotin-[acetyl-CoA-carboxylase] ligase
LAVVQAIERCTGLVPGLKWPNDILIDARKLGGILCETAAISRREDIPAYVIVGIGINVNARATAFPSLKKNIPISLIDILDKKIDIYELLNSVEQSLHEEINHSLAGPPSTLYARWSAHDALRGKEIIWTVDQHRRWVKGKGLGIDEKGCYVIQDQQGKLFHALSGDLTMENMGNGCK